MQQLFDYINEDAWQGVLIISIYTNEDAWQGVGLTTTGWEA